VKLTEELQNGIDTYLNTYAATFKAHIGQSIITRRKYARIAAIKASPKIGSMAYDRFVLRQHPGYCRCHQTDRKYPNSILYLD